MWLYLSPPYAFLTCKRKILIFTFTILQHNTASRILASQKGLRFSTYLFLRARFCFLLSSSSYLLTKFPCMKHSITSQGQFCSTCELTTCHSTGKVQIKFFHVQTKGYVSRIGVTKCRWRTLTYSSQQKYSCNSYY
jgi:hypothetical protein